MEQSGTHNIDVINIGQEMRQSYLDYAMSVIIGRALPDVRDGLKPVQRRVLYAMLEVGLLSTKKTSKCAGVVGEVLKKFHPHGDSSVYEALVHLVQPWAKRYALVDGQGNFGSIDGDPPAAYRYTECRLSAAGESLLTDIEQQTVDFIPNFDDSTVEPVVLPCVWPNLLVNGTDGIAVGMATHIPPHNLGETIDATIAYIKNPAISVDELMQIIPGPDFPTGGIISGIGEIKRAYATGKGIVKISARTNIEVIKKKGREVQALVITEIPYQVNKSSLIEKIAALVNDKAIEGISTIRDESDRDGMRIVIEVKKDYTPEVVQNQLFKLTSLRDSFGIINLAIVEGRPVVCTLPQILGNFVDHRRDVVARRTQFQLNKAEERMHILEGFKIALAHLDEVIELIKKSDSPAEAKDKLMKRYSLSDVQAQAILDLRLQKLTGMERLAIDKEHAELAREIERLRDILGNPVKIDEIIVTELTQAREKFADKRRTTIEAREEEDFVIEDLIEVEDMAVTVSHKGYIKRTSLDEYRAQKRGGKGVTGAAQTDDDYIEHLFVASTHDFLLIFTSLGRLYWLKVYEAPEAGRTAKGRALVNLLNMKEDEKIMAILPVKEFNDSHFVVMATAAGVIKKTELSAFSRPRSGGIIACSLDEGDGLIGVGLSSGKDDILLATADGQSIRFTEEDVRSMGRNARGVRGISLSEGDKAVGMTIVSPEDKSHMLLTVSENGYGKRTAMEEYRQQGRGGKGVIDIQTDERNGKVVGIAAVDEESGAMLITSSGKVIRISMKDISVIGRNTKGVRLINLEAEEKVAAVTHLAETNGEEE